MYLKKTISLSLRFYVKKKKTIAEWTKIERRQLKNLKYFVIRKQFPRVHLNYLSKGTCMNHVTRVHELAVHNYCGIQFY